MRQHSPNTRGHLSVIGETDERVSLAEAGTSPHATI
jgi:hypothetical protein